MEGLLASPCPVLASDVDDEGLPGLLSVGGRRGLGFGAPPKGLRVVGVAMVNRCEVWMVKSLVSEIKTNLSVQESRKGHVTCDSSYLGEITLAIRVRLGWFPETLEAAQRLSHSRSKERVLTARCCSVGVGSS